MREAGEGQGDDRDLEPGRRQPLAPCQRIPARPRALQHDPDGETDADLLATRRSARAPVPRRGSVLGEREEHEQDRHADAVVETALDVEALADRAGTASFAITTALPSAASVGASMVATSATSRTATWR